MRQPWFKQTNYIILLLIFVFPVGLFLMWRYTDWRKLTKSIISGIICLFFIAALTGDSSKTPTNPSPTMPTVTQPSTAATEVPTIDINGATKQGDVFVLKTQNASQVIKVKTTQMNGASGDTVTINGQLAKPSVSIFTYQTSLQEGDNSFDIIAKNPKGESSAKLVISYDPTALDTGLRVDAEALCQEYAEAKLGVKDINISYDSSSIERKNPDGTILIKVNIADSRGALHQEQPLGAMECTTSSDATRVITFQSY